MRIPGFTKPIVLTVTGGRDFDDEARVFAVMDGRAQYWLERYEENRLFIVHGGARGLDTLVENWAKLRKHPFARIPAIWDNGDPSNVHSYDKKAGAARNLQMLQWFHPKEVIAFPGGPGTANMVETALKYEFPVLKIGVKKGESEYLQPGKMGEDFKVGGYPTYWEHPESDSVVIANCEKDEQGYAGAGAHQVTKARYDEWIANDVDDLI